MNKKIYIFFTLLFISTAIFAQKKIGNKIYSYGDLENSINGKTLIHYGVSDPEGEVKVIGRFKREWIDAISWNKLFIPGYEYSDSEKNEALNKNNIETIILIKLNNISTATQSTSTSLYSGWTDSFNTFATTRNVIDNVGLVFEIYTKKDEFDKPVAVIIGNTKNIWGVGGSQVGLTLKVVERVLSAMKKEKAFE